MLVWCLSILAAIAATYVGFAGVLGINSCGEHGLRRRRRQKKKKKSKKRKKEEEGKKKKKTHFYTFLFRVPPRFAVSFFSLVECFYTAS